MKSPLEYASRCLSDIEDRWIPYSALWWRLWTPRIPRGERYQEGAFGGYIGDDDHDDDHMATLDIRRMLAVPLIRHIYKKLPYIDVVPVAIPWEDMSDEQRRQREEFAIASTLDAYAAGKALYPRATIALLEAQLRAAEEKLARRRKQPITPPTFSASSTSSSSSSITLTTAPSSSTTTTTTTTPKRPRKGRNPLHKLNPLRHHLRATLFSHCEAPQTAFLTYPSFDGGVPTHIQTWAPGAAITLSDGTTVYRPGRSQVEFRTVQELTQPDPGDHGDGGGNGLGRFVGDSWAPGIAWTPVRVVRRVMAWENLLEEWPSEEGQMGVEGLRGRLEENRRVVEASGAFRVLREEVLKGEKEGEVLKGVDKVVFFYGNGMSDDCDYCKRAMFLFAVAVCLRELVMELRVGGVAAEPVRIYMPAHDILRRWNPAETDFLHENGVEFVESNGELFLKVDERTAVLSYRNWNPVKQVVADIAKPAVLICRAVSDDKDADFGWKTEVNEEGETVKLPTVRSRFLEPSTIVVDPDSPRVRKLVKDYSRMDLPELPGTKVDKENVCLYLRKPDAKTKVEYL